MFSSDALWSLEFYGNIEILLCKVAAMAQNLVNLCYEDKKELMEGRIEERKPLTITILGWC